MRKREVAVFVLVALIACLLVFHRGIWGGALLAPVDIAPALISHYGYIDPASNGIPANHHIVDQLGYDLPLQWTIYHAYRRGEIPWWDPYTFCGRPLLADAHVSGTDPLRVLVYLVSPSFELAYNWTRIGHFLIGSIGFFFLLSRLRFPAFVAGSLALAGGFAACHGIYFGHPWIQASLIYYPWLWAVWYSSWESPRPSHRWAAVLLVFCILLAGNLQSHAYLALFGAIWMVAYSGYTWPGIHRAFWIVASSGLLGALLAAPVLLPQLELFLLNDRLIAAHAPIVRPVDGILSLTALFPWSLGTFRTVTYQNHGFLLFIGCAGVAMGLIGAFAKPQISKDSRAMTGAWRCALWLFLTFLIIMTVPPLGRVFYARCASLGVLGLIVLAAFGVRTWLEGELLKARWRVLISLVVIGTATGTYLSAKIVYPAVKSRVEETMLAHATKGPYGDSAIPLRKFQVANFPAEATFSNPEVLWGWLGLVAMAAVAFTASGKAQTYGLGAVLVLNLVPLLLFMQRCVPHTPIEQWHRLLAGGPEQRRVIERLRPEHRRLQDRAPLDFLRLFPQNFAHFYKIHTVHGYAALQPSSQAWSTSEVLDVADWAYTTQQVRSSGELIPLTFPDTSRFRWEADHDREVQVVSETLNQLELHFPPGKGDLLIRTDTWYPGWSSWTSDGQPLRLESWDKASSTVHVPEGVTAIMYEYQPRGLRIALLCSAVGLVGTLVPGRWLSKRRVHSEDF